MGKKSKSKHEVVSAGLEVVSEQRFQERLEAMSSKGGAVGCHDCQIERSKCASSHHRHHRQRHNKKLKVKAKTPIVIHLKDTLRPTSKGTKLRNQVKNSVTIETDLDNSSMRSEQLESLAQFKKYFCAKGKKNFNAFLNAIERVHFKDPTDLSANLDWQAERDWLSHKTKRYSKLNNHSLSLLQDSLGFATAKRLIKRGCVDLICNDLSSSSNKSQDTDNSDDSENCSIISNSDSLSESDISSGEGAIEELSKEELDSLVEYTTGVTLTKYDCPQEECPECLASTAAWYSYYYPQPCEPVSIDIGHGFSVVDITCNNHQHVVDKVEEGATADEDSEDAPHIEEDLEEDRRQHLDDHEDAVEGDHVQEEAQGACALGQCQSDVERSYSSEEDYVDKEPTDTIYVDLTEKDVTFSVYYHAQNTIHCEWYLPCHTPPPIGYFPYPQYSVPYYTPPAYYMPYSVLTIPRPLCVPRNLPCLNSQRLCMVPAYEVKNFTGSQPPQRPWIPLAHPERNRPTAIFTVMCYNVLCDKYATRQLYGYCPSWALGWEYRKKGIIEEIRHYNADIINLQEVETDQFYNFFQPELKRDGYEGIFSPKSRARTMSESDRKHVDGCAIFFKTSKFSLHKEYLVEFNQLAMANAEGSEEMLNRVMTKDNIGIAAVLQTKEAIWDGLPPENQIHQPILVTTAHIHWDPEFCDVKLIQTMMLMAELKNIVKETTTKLRPGGGSANTNALPLILCGDLNSLPDSGVIEYLTTGKISTNHEDFKEFGYETVLQKMSSNEKRDVFSHDFRLSQGYLNDIIPYTNYTFDFKGVIDYIFYSRESMNPLGLLGPLDQEWFRENKVLGCPHPHIPSDHLPLLIEFQMPATSAATGNNSAPSRSGNGHLSHMVRR